MVRILSRLLLAAVLAGPAAAGTPLKARKQTKLTFPDGKAIVVDVVDTPVEREAGLMFRKKLPKDYGMLFVFPYEDNMVFWMKNTLVSLDIVFIDTRKRVVKAFEKVKKSTEQTPDEEVVRVGNMPAAYVLELPAGAAARHRLKTGDVLTFTAETPAH